MFIYFAESYKCRRFGVKGAEKITIRPSKKTQMVLGTNGSGKSSLLKFIMTVIPPDKKHFHTGGHKIVKVLHNGSKYRLETVYEKGSPKHSFRQNGEELNAGGTGVVMDELIRQHFGMTRVINDVLNGTTKFTEMPTLDRREWITRLSATDFNYVLDLYNRIRKAARDQDAIMRNSRSRLAEERPKLLAPDQEEALHMRAAALHEELNMLMEDKSSMTWSQQETAEKLQQEHNELERRIGVFLRTAVIKKVPGYSIRNLQDLYDHAAKVREQLSHQDSVMSVLGEQLHDVEAKVHQIRSISGMDESFVSEALLSARNEHVRLTHQLRTNVSPEALAAVQRHDLIKVEHIRTALMEITTSIVEKFTDEAHQKARNELDRLYAEHHRLHGNISSVEGRIDHIHNCAEVTCPKCRHDFKPGVGEHEVEALMSGSERDRKALDQVVARMDELRSFVGEAQVYRGKITEIEQMRMTERGLAPLWSYIDDQGGFSRGVQLTRPIMDFIEDVKTAWEIKENRQKIDLYQDSMNRFKEASANSSVINEQYVEIKGKVEVATAEINRLQNQLAELNGSIAQNERLDAMYKALQNDVSRINKLKGELVEAIRQDHITEAFGQTRNSLVSINNMINVQGAQRFLVNDIEAELARATKDHEMFKRIDNEMSPKDGMIAEQIGLFINVVINKINEVIARVWGFNLALLPLDLQEKAMDYKFPLYNGHKDNDSSDVSEGSDSMKEIVDQAFRLVVYKMMGLKDFPLYIDELGKGFDPVHRANLVFAIKDMIDDPMYSQVFIISHYEDGQNSYPNSEIIVTDDSHVQLTREYNQHVVFG